MRVATWNMNFRDRTAAAREASWGFLADSIRPDLALLQETMPPTGSSALYRNGGIGGGRPWGSAILAPSLTLQEVSEVTTRFSKDPSQLTETFPGSTIVGLWDPPAGDAVVFVSVYGVIDHGYALTTVHRALSDLTPLFDTRLGRRVVLGGDLNCSTQLPPPDRERHRNLFERIAGLGLVDLIAATRASRPRLADCPCEDAEECSHVQTHRHGQSPKPWHDDYLFATKPVAERLTSCTVLDSGEPDPWSFSDHCPVVAGLDL